MNNAMDIKHLKNMIKQILYREILCGTTALEY